MRIISGIARGMPLVVPASGVRPTADRIRAAIFSSLGERVVDADVLDLFAGTGALGLEAASRGAHSVLFVEQARAALQCLERNLTSFRKNPEASCELTVAQGTVSSQLSHLGAESPQFSLIFADPPYGSAAQELLRNADLPKLLTGDGLLVLESAKRDESKIASPWETVREVVYGDTRVNFLKLRAMEDVQ